MTSLINMKCILSGKDSRWLQLDVCREFQRNKCSRTDTECRFSHPPPNVEVQNGRVICCYDSIKVIKDFHIDLNIMLFPNILMQTEKIQ